MIPGTRDYSGNCSAFLTTTLSALIVCVLCSTSIQAAVAETAHKTDAELAETLVGTWEIFPSRIGVSKRFITFNADGTSKATAITTNDRGHPPGRVENEGRWHVSQGYLIREITKMTPAFHNVHAPLKVRVKIESIENGTVKLRPADIKKVAISAPQPDYPIDARRKRIEGYGIFKLNVAKDGTVNSLQVAEKHRKQNFGRRGRKDT